VEAEIVNSRRSRGSRPDNRRKEKRGRRDERGGQANKPEEKKIWQGRVTVEGGKRKRFEKGGKPGGRVKKNMIR